LPGSWYVRAIEGKAEKTFTLEVPPAIALAEFSGLSGVKNHVSRPSRRERAQASRRRLVESALAAFTERGDAATTVESADRDPREERSGRESRLLSGSDGQQVLHRM